MARTLYDVLMISPLADSQLVAAVYRHLAKRYHPDVDPSPAAAARMAELNEAYAILSDAGKRARYDASIGRVAGQPRPHPSPEAAATWAASPPPGSGTDVAAPDGPMGATSSAYGEAGPPPANPAPTGSVLTFGRYRGWTLDQVGRVDRDYLEWLARTTMGRNYRNELEQLLRRG